MSRSRNDGGTSAIKHEEHHQTARIIQWLGGERAGRYFYINIDTFFLFYK